MRIIFTQHAKDKIYRRKILQQEVLDAIAHPDRLSKKHGKYFYQKSLERGKIEIVCEQTESNIKIITLYWI